MRTLHRSEMLSHCQVMSVLFAQNLGLWSQRKNNKSVRKVLVGLREFNPSPSSDPRLNPNASPDPSAFDLIPYAVKTLRDPLTGDFLFTDAFQVSLGTLIQKGVLPAGSDSSYVRLNELFEHRRYFPGIASGTTRTTQAVIKAMVDVTADCGADAIMIDTSILTKVSNVPLVDTRSDGMVDINSLVVRNGMMQQGILPLPDLRFFVDYCHYRGHQRQPRRLDRKLPSSTALGVDPGA